MTKIFIDGAYGTVGMALRNSEIIKRLVDAGVEVIEISEEDRRNRSIRGDAYAEADLVVLCLPDSEAAEAAVRVDRANHRARILDASAFHRCDPDWVYGLPQITGERRIAGALRVANPGCFATACILAANPLSLPAMDFHGITGSSAGGKNAKNHPRLSQFGQEHRHLAEIRKYGVRQPTLTTAVGSWYQGMLVQATVPMHPAEVHLRYVAAYGDDSSMRIVYVDEDPTQRIAIESCNGTNQSAIYVASLPQCDRTAIAVVLDNLGKGSAGAAAANIALMIGM